METLDVFVIVLLLSQHALCVEVYEGAESVLLPCSTHLSDVSGAVWRRSTAIVHAVSLKGVDQHQDQRYVNRTALGSGALRSGDLSLHLAKPSVQDSDNYTCVARKLGQDVERTDVELMVRGHRRNVSWLFSTAQGPVPVIIIIVIVFVFVFVLIFIICWKRRRKDQRGQFSLVVPDPPSISGPTFHPPNRKQEVESGAESVQLSSTEDSLSEDTKVEWMDGSDKMVHVYQNMSDRPEEQHPDYRGRTQMSEDPLGTGDLSLTLRHPTIRDSGTYTCTIRSNRQVLQRRVELQVNVPQVEVESGAGSVQLPFNTTADLPETSILKWCLEEEDPSKPVHVFCVSNPNEEQHPDYRGRTEMSEDPLGTGDLSLTLRHPTIRDSRTYSCRVFREDGGFLREKIVQLGVKGGILADD